MFAYIQVIKNNSSISYGYSNFSISNGILSIKQLQGMKHSTTERISIDKITNIKEDSYYGWNRIKFDYNDAQFVFLYSGFGEFDYLKESLMATILA